MLFIGLLNFFISQSILYAVSFPVSDFVVKLAMGLFHSGRFVRVQYPESRLASSAAAFSRLGYRSHPYISEITGINEEGLIFFN